MSGNTEHLQVVPWTVHHHELLSPLLTSRQINPTLWLNSILGSDAPPATPLHRQACSLCTGLLCLSELAKHPVIHPVDRGPAGGIKRIQGRRRQEWRLHLKHRHVLLGSGMGWEGMGIGNGYCILTVLSYKDEYYFKIYPDLASGSTLRRACF